MAGLDVPEATEQHEPERSALFPAKKPARVDAPGDAPRQPPSGKKAVP
jgi:hypothetical protein